MVPLNHYLSSDAIAKKNRTNKVTLTKWVDDILVDNCPPAAISAQWS